MIRYRRLWRLCLWPGDEAIDSAKRNQADSGNKQQAVYIQPEQQRCGHIAAEDIDVMMDRTCYEPVISKAAKDTMVSNSVSLSTSRPAETIKACD